jgi:hypothetical protein
VDAAKGQRFECTETPAKKPLSDASSSGFAAATQWLPVDANAPADCAHKKDLQMQAFLEAAEGIRTLDLLHGKQDPRLVFCVECSCKEAVFRTCRGAPQSTAFTR